MGLAAGSAHTCALMDDGSVSCWGSNAFGQLGDGSDVMSSSVPVRVGELRGVTALAASSEHTCALAAGQVHCWGNNRYGQLGQLGVMTSARPLPVPGGGGATALAAGPGTAVPSSTGVACAAGGETSRAQLGDRAAPDVSPPVAAVGLTGAVAVGVGTSHTCALMADRSVRCWGSNQRSQVGAGTSTTLPLAGLDDAVALATAGDHNCVLRASGRVWCWGSNQYGQLGNGTTIDSLEPTEVQGLDAVTALASSGGATCGLLGDGRLRCWGSNSFGQLGDGTALNESLPVPVSGVSNARALCTGGGGDGSGHSCVLLQDGAVRCWGMNRHGQLGDGTKEDSNQPVSVVAL